MMGKCAITNWCVQQGKGGSAQVIGAFLGNHVCDRVLLRDSKQLVEHHFVMAPGAKVPEECVLQVAQIGRALSEFISRNGVIQGGSDPGFYTRRGP